MIIQIEVSNERLNDRYLLYSFVVARLNQKAPEGTEYDFDSSHIVEQKQGAAPRYFYINTHKHKTGNLHEIELVRSDINQK